MGAGKWLLAGNVTYVFLQWIVISIFSKNYTSSELGLYFLALAICAPIFIFFSIKLPVIIITDESVYDDKVTVNFIRSSLSFLAMMLSVLISLFFSEEGLTLLVVLVSVFKFMEHFDELRVARHQKHKRFKNIFNIKLKRGFLYALFVFISSVFSESLVLSLACGTAMYSAFWIISSASMLFVDFQSLSARVVKVCLRSGVALGSSAALSSAVVSGTRLYVGTALGTAALAIFGSIGYTVVAFTLLVSALGQYYLPYFVEVVGQRKMFFKKVVESQVVVGLIGGVFMLVSYFGGEYILSLAYNPEIGSYWLCFFLVVVGMFFKSSSALIGTSINATREYGFQLKFSVLSLVLIVIVMPYMVAEHGIMGAFGSVVMVNFVEWLAYLWFGFAHFREFYEKFNDEAL